ncbi:ankyrin repeat-containing domain protein [Xylaria venustula]|nr:ankyrin repeat-containing domain protein [Xylaria venustula]
MGRKSSKLSDQQWDDHKALIRDLYLVQDNSLKEFHSKLKEQGLDATIHQIETKLRAWRFRKNINKDTWKQIDRHIAKRKRDGKESEVILCGKRMKPETVAKETDRHGDRSIFAQLAIQRNLSPSPLTDCQVAVCTPQPIKMEFEWPTTLPWLRFSSRELPMILKACKPFAPGNQNASSGDLVSAILPKAFRTDMAHIGVSKLAAIIGRSMPETYPQENLQRAESLLSGSAEDFMREYVSMIMYNVSNNSLDLEKDDKWEQTIKFLEDCGIFRLNVDFRKGKSPTIDGFMENLFDASIHRCLSFVKSRGARAETVAKWLVTSGYCPKTATKYLWGRLHSPYTYRLTNDSDAQGQVLNLTRHFLRAGADADILLEDSNQTILEFALKRPWSSDTIFNLAELLFNYGASKNLDRALHSAIGREEEDLIELIVQHGGNLIAGLEPLSDSPLYTETSLTIAASTGLQQTRHILSLLSSRYASTPLTTFITPDVFIAAAAKGHNDTIQFLYEISPTIMANESGITPLHAAASRGYLSTCQLLLPLQAAHNTWTTTKFTPFHAACRNGYKDVMEFLILNGTDVNVTPKFDFLAEGETRLTRWIGLNSCHPGKTPLYWVMERAQRWDAGLKTTSNYLSCAAMLIRAGAKLVGSELSIAAKYCHLDLLEAGIAAGADPKELDWAGKTALQRALEEHRLQRLNELHNVVSLLLSNGAQLRGGEVDSAVGLKQWEVARLLIEHGGSTTTMGCTKALEKAIFARDNEWAAWIFDIEPSVYGAGALCAAIVVENDSLIQRLILNRPAEMSEDPFEITAIAVAVVSGNLALLQELLAHSMSCRTGPIPIKKDDWPLYRSLTKAIRNGKYRPDTVDMETMASHWFRGSPLAVVASSRRSDALEATSRLLESGFCADELTWMVAASFKNTAFIQTLLSHGQHGGYSYQKFDGWTPLVYAIQHRDKELVTLLLAAGISVNGYEPYVGKPLIEAVRLGYLDMVDCLIQAGAAVNINTRHPVRHSPLQIAVKEGKTDIVHRLVQAGADVNSPAADWGGATALQFAAINGHLGLAKYLIDKGAQANAPPSRFYGRTALQGAAEHGRLDMLEFLLTEGALTTGQWRRRFIKAVKLAIKERHFVAADLLKQSAGWSDEDENLLLSVDVNSDTDFEAGEGYDTATDDTMDSSDEESYSGSGVGSEIDMSEEE